MDALTPLSVSACGLLKDPKIEYLNEGTVVFASGNGLVLQDIGTGTQVRFKKLRMSCHAGMQHGI